MSYAIVFSGQGTQHPEMLPWLESTDNPASVQPVLSALQSAVGSGWRNTLQDSTQRQENVFAQTLITGTSLAAWAALQPFLASAPTAMAGYSVGELAAAAAAEMLSTQDALRLARVRADCMTRCVTPFHTGLMSISGLRHDAIDTICAGLHIHLDRAIDLGVDQGIYAGTAGALHQANTAPNGLSAAGAQCKPLAISIASHSHWMTGAVQPLAAALSDLTWNAPSVALALNATGALSRQVPIICRALAAQVAQTVQWATCMEALRERGVRCVLEIGPGNALATLWNRRFPDIPARAIDDFQHPSGAARWINAIHETSDA